MKCPVCGSIGFYVKDPEDEYETHSFEFINREACFPEGREAGPEIGPDSHLFCERCAWNDKMSFLKK